MITASPTAPEGSVLTLSEYAPSDFPPTSAILCRNTAPLVAFAFALLRRSVGVRILGREIGTNLITIVTKAKAGTLDELRTTLETNCRRELARAFSRENLSAAAAIRDKYDCLNLFVQNATSVDDLIQRIKTLFDDTNRGLLTLATIHKSKGLEWPQVFLLDFHELLPSRWATQSWQLQQERNLQYVGVTRAQRDLRYIKSDCWKDSTNQN